MPLELDFLEPRADIRAALLSSIEETRFASATVFRVATSISLSAVIVLASFIFFKIASYAFEYAV